MIDNDVLARILNCLALGVRSQCNCIRTTFEGPVTGCLELSHRKSKLHSEAEKLAPRPNACLADVRGHIEKTIIAEPPISLADGGVIADGIDAELDELRGLNRNGKQYIAKMEERERERTEAELPLVGK